MSISGSKQFSRDTGVDAARPLELFFDLVFVFTISQLATRIAHPHGAASVIDSALAFVTATWQYISFVWLSGNLQLNAKSKLQNWVFFGGMFAFFGMSVGIGHLDHGGGTFALSVLGATLLNQGMLRQLGESNAAAARRMAPYTVGFAVVVLISVFLPTPWREILWALASTMIAGPVLTRGFSEFPVNFSTKHFVERHSLAVIIALGESVVALGAGLNAQHLDALVVSYAIVGLLLIAVFWWLYFGQTLESVEHHISYVRPEQRTDAAGFFAYAHYPLLAGAITVAAALEVGIHHPGHVGEALAWNLSIGLMLYLFGMAWLHQQAGLHLTKVYLGGGLLALASVLLGLHVSAMAQLISALVIMLGVGLGGDAYAERKTAASKEQGAQHGA